MSDRFKFRVWDGVSNKYIDKGVLLRCGDLAIPTMKNDYDLNPVDGCYLKEQCTGLKDKNGKLIYENDLLKDYNGIWQVKWHNEEGAFYIWNKKRDFYLSPFIGEYEIVGNIHENPELLEEEVE